MKFFLAVLVIALSIGGVLYLREESKINSGQAIKEIGGTYSLTNQDGQIFNINKYDDKYKLTFFGFTHCPHICPTTLSVISNLLEELGNDAAKIKPVFITVDPARDNPARLKEFSKNFDSRITYLTGNTKQIDAVKLKYKAYGNKVKGDAPNYDMNHSTMIYLLNKDNYYLAHFSYTDDMEKIKEIIKSKID